jgi:flagellar basal-body rod protein FlgG
MIRGMWAASTGMKTQQGNIDVISNNLANVNTTSYKKQRAEFKDLLYSTMKKPNQESPVNLQFGHGAMMVATTKEFHNGTPLDTQNPLDVAIDGDGFFVIQLPNGQERYTRDGSFKLSVENGESTLVTSDGYYVLTEDGGNITIPENTTDFTVSQDGSVTVRDDAGEVIDLGRLRFVQFVNNQGLAAEGRNLYAATDASGEAVDVDAQDMSSTIVQGYLESSNVQVVDEMVKMITAQRAYEINSKAIQTGDDMLQIANNLKR